MDRTSNDLGTALGIGTGIILITTLFGLNLGSTAIPFSPRSRREEARVSFVGDAPIILAEAATTEYVNCDTEHRHGISWCRLWAPGPIERIIVAVRPWRSLECRRTTPLVWIDDRPETTTFVGVEAHKSYTHCIYLVRRTTISSDGL